MYIHTMKQTKTNCGQEVVVLPCACANLRRAARLVSQSYEHALRPAGIKGTQFTLLQALVLAGNISQGRLGDLLGLDSTTLTRTLALLRKKGWIRSTPGEDRREVRLALTPEGLRKYRKARHYWESAQRRLREALGEAGWKQIIEATVRAAAVEAGARAM
jgi:DNA-binding MarR family transcriptional regulator